ncbi:unnamed protein product, partial [Schistosoma curassoni]|uniref:Calpain catalytic domain-containing protein n=1 Tax=Schistosoma curassoni TaxID=6186 RepID=A0A183JD47_9TREM
DDVVQKNDESSTTKPSSSENKTPPNNVIQKDYKSINTMLSIHLFMIRLFPIIFVIYPQGITNEAIYNPCGKYMVRLNFNGVPRKVIIDDFLPMGKDGKLLCCYSNNQNELWVSLLEKAYMKVMGGYDFPGSNSNIDLHALTGWIPERISIRSSSTSFDKDREFRRLLSRFHKGHCLVTIATGQLSDDESERSGLVPTHAYAMLDIREVEGYRLFLLKNPWSHMRWKGNFSERDSKHWTPSMQAKLNFDRSSAQLIDNGVFWIDYDSLCHFFDVFYINWDPGLFQYTTCKDSYASAENPQYNLEVTAQTESPIWVLLTRHIADFAENKEFIAVVVYKDVKSRKVYYPYDPAPFCDSVRINSPHCLVKMLQDPGTCNYILLISQYEKSITIYYTLRVYSTAPFTLSKIKDPYTISKQVRYKNHNFCCVFLKECLMRKIPVDRYSLYLVFYTTTNILSL